MMALIDLFGVKDAHIFTIVSLHLLSSVPEILSVYC